MNKSVRTQAKVGGEIGLNGEFYKGGEFLPSSEKTVKGAYKIKKGTKAKIAPYVWDAAPDNDMLSVYERAEHWCSDNRAECQFVKGQGFVGLKLTPSRPLCAITSIGVKSDDQIDESFAFAAILADKFNQGERWFPLADDPFHYKNQVSK